MLTPGVTNASVDCQMRIENRHKISGFLAVALLEFVFSNTRCFCKISRWKVGIIHSCTLFAPESKCKFNVKVKCVHELADPTEISRVF